MLRSLVQRVVAQHVQPTLDARFLDRLLAGARGRAFLINSLIDAEEADEQGVFDRLLADVTDPTLHKVVRTHRDDETRHGEVLRACLERNGFARAPVVESLRIVPYIEHALDQVATAYVERRAGVMEAYLFLQVLEERAVLQYPRFGRAFAAAGDRATAEVVFAVAKDEERHVKYARAVSRRYAPDPETLERTLARYRAAEARAYTEHGRATLRHVVAERLLDVAPPERLMWRALAA